MIVVVGLSHKTAPIDVRERAALSEEAMVPFLKSLTSLPQVAEALTISTCNRMEVIATPRAGVQAESLLEEITQALGQRIPGISDHLYKKTGEEALRHLFRVAASLDSLVMGEPQILGQVKGALEFAKQCGTVGQELSRAVERAVRAAKRVRSETAIGAGQVSVPSMAVELARQIFGQLENKALVLVGSGAMGETAAKLIVQSGARLFVVGRNQERRDRLCAELGGSSRSFDELPQALWEADVVITATAAPEYVIDFPMMRQVHKKRRGRSLFFIDLAVPRDIDPKIDQLESVYLYNVDDLSDLVNQSLSSRQREAERAHQIITQEAEAFARLASARQATPTVVKLRMQFTTVLQTELQRSLKGRLKHLEADDRAALDKMIDSAVNKMLHPTGRLLRQLAADKEMAQELDSYSVALRDLFGLDQALDQAASSDATATPHEADALSAVDDEAEKDAAKTSSSEELASGPGAKLTKVG